MNQGYWGGKFSTIVEEIVVWGKVFLTKKGWLKYICPKKCLLWLLWIHFCAANSTNLLMMLFFSN